MLCFNTIPDANKGTLKTSILTNHLLPVLLATKCSFRVLDGDAIKLFVVRILFTLNCLTQRGDQSHILVLLRIEHRDGNGLDPQGYGSEASTHCRWSR